MLESFAMQIEFIPLQARSNPIPRIRRWPMENCFTRHEKRHKVAMFCAMSPGW